ncbi:MAG: hypothetical protein Q7T81_10835 [Pseudolabrys sp.]|nr:hypothetical protein [Pseudolabrys sp.]
MASVDGTLNSLLKVALAVAVAACVALSVFVVVSQMALDRDAADRRALIQRQSELTTAAAAPGSALSCLDAGAGDTVETACEDRVFATPQSAAAAVAYIGARLSLLTEAAETQPTALRALAASRRALELDRYGITAHVLASRESCTVDRCGIFAHLTDASAVKANMKAQAFDQYVSRHASAWNATPGAPAESAPPAMSAAPPTAPVQSAAVAGPPVAQPMSDKYTLPSAASIPAVSIMNSEPPLPKGAAEAQAQAPAQGTAQAQGQGAAPFKGEIRPDDDVPMPRKRPQARAEPAPEPAAPTATVR